MATKHFVIDPNGKRHTRTSQNRTYAFAVIVRDGYQQALARATSTNCDAQHARNYAYYVALANGTHAHCSFSDAERSIASAKAKIADCPTVEAYLAKLTADAVAAVEAAKAKGKYDEFGVYGWCGRYDLAQKLAAKARSINYFDCIEIVDAQTDAPTAPKKSYQDVCVDLGRTDLLEE